MKTNHLTRGVLQSMFVLYGFLSSYPAVSNFSPLSSPPSSLEYKITKDEKAQDSDPQQQLVVAVEPKEDFFLASLSAKESPKYPLPPSASISLSYPFSSIPQSSPLSEYPIFSVLDNPFNNIMFPFQSDLSLSPMLPDTIDTAVEPTSVHAVPVPDKPGPDKPIPGLAASAISIDNTLTVDSISEKSLIFSISILSLTI